MGLLERIWGVELKEPYTPTTEQRAVTPPSRNEVVITETTALSLVAVSRAVSVLETAIQQIPVEVYRGIEKIDTPTWLITPDVENNVSQSELIGKTVVSMATTGNAYWKVTRGTRGIVNIEILDPKMISIERDMNGKIRYLYNTRTYSNREIVHIKLWQSTDYNKLLGEGPLQRHLSTLRSALDLQNYADNWFRTAAVPTGALTTTEFLSEDVAIQNKQAFIESQQQRSVAVLSSGLKYEPIMLNPEEAQFLENQKFLMRLVAVMFGIPPKYLGMSEESAGMVYTNGNEDRNRLYEDGLQLYIMRIQQAITDLLPRGQEARFNMTTFLRPNQLVRFQAYEIALASGFMTVNEVREFEGMPELPQNMIDVEEPGDIENDIDNDGIPDNEDTVNEQTV